MEKKPKKTFKGRHEELKSLNVISDILETEVKYHIKMTAVWHYIWPQPEKWRRSPRGFILYPFSPHRLALFSFSHSPTQSAIQISSSVQPSVSIPIPDRPTGHAQVACPSCREWQTANIPQWTGFSCLIPIAAFFFFFPSRSCGFWAQIPVCGTRGTRRELWFWAQAHSVHHLQHLPQWNIQFIL